MPQIVVRLVMARTMVEGGYSVKTAAFWARIGAVNADLTQPSHPPAYGTQANAGRRLGDFMRIMVAAAAMTAVLLGAGSASAEKRLFIIANNPDAYGVDRCLTTGESCGKTVATSYCHSHEYEQALSFQKVDRDDITGAIPSEGPEACRGSSCNYVAIECSR